MTDSHRLSGRMKKRVVILLAAVYAVFLLTSCADNGQTPIPPEIVPPGLSIVTPGPSALPAATATDIILPDGLAEDVSGLWAKIDGSTATIPLTTALYGVFGGDKLPPTHNTTADAYYNLFRGSADLIFVTHPSENELAEAQGQGIELEIIPIVKDALVFLVNIENPVDSVTLEQLRDIYTGKITSWKTVGGLSENIVPYQRTLNSGSQTLLEKLVMAGLETMPPPVEWVAETMGSLVEVVSSYDNAREAVGYSMFYYVNNMYGNSRFKLLGIDGVKPSRDTITRGEYPLEDHYYAVLRKDAPDEAPARKLIAWLLTEDGQTVATHAGYIPLRPLENSFPDEAVDPVYLGDVDNSSGTGGTDLKSPNAINDIVVNGVRKPLSDIFYDGFNYIMHINSEIISWMDSPMSVYRYSESLRAPRLTEHMKRPFTGIPNNYPNYELVDYGLDNRYIRINLPESNPFFKDQMSFDIRLTEDISPYGRGLNNFSVMYGYNGRLLPNVDLYTLKVRLPGSPEIAERINERLAAWYGGFPGGDDKTALIEGFRTWFAGMIGYPDYVCSLQPSYGLWENYLSVSYTLQTYDGPATNNPMLYTICFDINTGEAVNLAEKLPRNIPYLEGMILDPITRYEAVEHPSQAYYEDYVPADGSVITSAWLWSSALCMYVTEPDGRELHVIIYDWKIKTE